MKDLVSIIIPCFDHGEYLGESIASALVQTHPATEVIVVDDGSTDETRTVAASFGTAVRYLRQDNAGVAAARNAGLSLARGEHLVFLDADDMLDPAYVEKCLARFRADPALAFVYTQFEAFGADRGISSFPAFGERRLRRGNFVHVSALLRADLVRDHGFCTELRGWEDWDLYLGLVERGYRGELVDEPLLRYRKHAGKPSRMSSALDDLGTRRAAMLTIVRRHPGLYPPGARLAVELRYAARRLLFRARGAAGRRAPHA